MVTQINSINVVSAHKRIADLIQKTPCVPEAVLSDKLQARVFLKLENFQRTGSFKERGALNYLRLMTQKERALGVVTASAGNHAQAVAYHARHLGIQATIFMPQHTPEIKAAHTKAFGATVYFVGDSYDEAHEAALIFAQKSGSFYLHAYDDNAVISGQGTVALEIRKQIPSVDMILCPVGGGGLISGMAVALKDQPVQIIGVQSARMPSMKQALESKGPVRLPSAQTFADGIRVRRAGHITYSICQKLVSKWFLVSEDSMVRAMLHLLEMSKIVAEAAGAVALVPLLENQLPDLKGKTVCVVVTGGNIDINLQSTESGQRSRMVLTLNEVLG